MEVLRLGADCFPPGLVACCGNQLAALLALVGRVHDDVRWYAADIQPALRSLESFVGPVPTLVGSTKDAIGLFESVPQFEAGVFVAVSSAISRPVFRSGGLWTEDEAMADLGDSLVELRAFDASFISIATRDAGLLGEVMTAHPLARR
ncbi:MAG: hypothetical protein Q8L14_00265 [Myxococcales bacterium]|nr:hypothetical protein [Myxococcales bacterium]